MLIKALVETSTRMKAPKSLRYWIRLSEFFTHDPSWKCFHLEVDPLWMKELYSSVLAQSWAEVKLLWSLDSFIEQIGNGKKYK